MREFVLQHKYQHVIWSLRHYTDLHDDDDDDDNDNVHWQNNLSGSDVA